MRRRRFRPGGLRLRPVLAAAVAVLAALALAMIGGGAASARTAAPHTVAASVAAAAPVAPAATRTIRYRVVNATGRDMSVTLINARVGRWRAGDSPAVGDVLEPLETYDYNIENTNSIGDADGLVQYRIATTDYYVVVVGYNPHVGSNTGSCKITDKTGKINYPSSSGWKCEFEIGKGNDSDVSAVVEPSTAATHTLTDSTPLSRRDAVDGLCASYPLPKNVSCKAGTLENIDATLGAPQIASSVLVNCGSAENSLSVSSDYTVSQTNTIGVSVTAQVALSNAWSVSVTGTYEHSWTESQSKSQTATLNVPSGRYGWVEGRPAVISITGNYTLQAGNQTYSIGDFTVSEPATPDWVKKNSWAPKDLLFTHDSAMNAASVCAGRSSPFQQPQPSDIRSGSIYSLAVAGRNQWALTALDTSNPDVNLSLQTLTGARNQRWTFVPVAGQPAGTWQIASASTPSQCLSSFGGTGRDTYVARGGCKAPGDPTLGNELWTTLYDPALGGYELIQPASQRRIALEKEDLAKGDLVYSVRWPIINRSRWVLRPAI